MVDKGKSSFLQNIVEEIRPGCRNLATKVPNNGKFVRNIPGWMMVEVKSGVWVERYGLDKNFFYRYGGEMLLLVRCSQA